MFHRSRFPSQFFLLTAKPRSIITDQWRGQCLKVPIFGFWGIEASPIFNMCLTTDFILPLGANLFPFLIPFLHRGAAPNFSQPLYPFSWSLRTIRLLGTAWVAKIFPHRGRYLGEIRLLGHVITSRGERKRFLFCVLEFSSQREKKRRIFFFLHPISANLRIAGHNNETLLPRRKTVPTPMCQFSDDFWRVSDLKVFAKEWFWFTFGHVSGLTLGLSASLLLCIVKCRAICQSD